MNQACNYVSIHLKIDADVNVAPIHSHYVLQAITNIIKDIAELEKVGTRTCVISNLAMDYIPVRDEDMPIKKGES